MRMLCTACWQTARPDIRLSGSDRLELVGWFSFFLPGLLYCAWRYVNRTRVCAACGSAALVREARAVQRREPPLRSVCDLAPGVEYALARAEELVSHALGRLEPFPNSAAKDSLRQLGEFVLERKW